MHHLPSPRALVRCRRGATAIEYGLILALLVVVCMGGIRVLGGGNGGKWTNLSERVAAVSPTA